MTKDEFTDWLDFHSTRFTKVGETFAAMGSTRSKEVLAAWFAAIGEFDLDVAKQATETIFGDDASRPYGFDAHPGAVAKVCGAIKRARAAQADDPTVAAYRPNALLRGRKAFIPFEHEPMKRAAYLERKKSERERNERLGIGNALKDAMARVQEKWTEQDREQAAKGQPRREETYKCQWCRDTGIVNVWHPIMIDADRDGVDDVLNEDFSLPCCCEAGDGCTGIEQAKRNGRMIDPTRFNRHRMVRKTRLGGLANYRLDRDEQFDLVKSDYVPKYAGQGEPGTTIEPSGDTDEEFYNEPRHWQE